MKYRSGAALNMKDVRKITLLEVRSLFTSLIDKLLRIKAIVHIIGEMTVQIKTTGPAR